jgi:hypothetical protein
MEAIKGNIGAIRDIAVTMFFRRRGLGKSVPGGSGGKEMIYPFWAHRFTYPLSPAILRAANFPAT